MDFIKETNKILAPQVVKHGIDSIFIGRDFTIRFETILDIDKKHRGLRSINIIKTNTSYNLFYIRRDLTWDAPSYWRGCIFPRLRKLARIYIRYDIKNYLEGKPTSFSGELNVDGAPDAPNPAGDGSMDCTWEFTIKPLDLIEYMSLICK